MAFLWLYTLNKFDPFLYRAYDRAAQKIKRCSLCLNFPDKDWGQDDFMRVRLGFEGYFVECDIDDLMLSERITTFLQEHGHCHCRTPPGGLAAAAHMVAYREAIKQLCQ